MATPTILVVDDEQLIRWSIAERLRDLKYAVLEADSAATALHELRESPDLVLLDQRLPDVERFELLDSIKAAAPDVPVIMMTAYSSIENAVEAMKRGAHHYLTKPIELDEVQLLVEKTLETTSLRREVKELRAARAAPYDFDDMIGQSPTMQAAKAFLEKIAASPASTVLLVGESGTGKDLAAKVLHYNSARAERPFMNITCSALSENLLESELFGHERGAFTDAKQKKQGLLELARTGTLFLDEVSELPHDLQPKLLRALEERRVRRIGGYEEIEVRCRVVAATNESLEEAVAEGRFREDLFYRLNVLRVALPPLRARQGDVTVLARHFLAGLEEDQGLPPVRLSPDALRALEAHTWPGNVRELKNVLERAALLCDGGVILPSDLSLGGRRRMPADAAAQATGFIAIPAEGRTLSSVESEAIRLSLGLTGWNRSAAARILDISRPTLARKIELYGLSPDVEHGTVQ